MSTGARIVAFCMLDYIILINLNANLIDCMRNLAKIKYRSVRHRQHQQVRRGFARRELADPLCPTYRLRPLHRLRLLR